MKLADILFFLVCFGLFSFWEINKVIACMFAGQINQSTSISEEEIYFNLTHRNNYSLKQNKKQKKIPRNNEMTIVPLPK